MWSPRHFTEAAGNMATSSNGNAFDSRQAGPSTLSNSNSCGFCKLPLDMDASFTRKIKCGHTLHLSCLNEHLPTAKKCPICKTSIKWRDVTDKCAVCLDPLLQGTDKLVTPTCRHAMHYECVKQLLTTRSRCPVCRKNLHNILNLMSDGEEEESDEESEPSEESTEEEEDDDEEVSIDAELDDEEESEYEEEFFYAYTDSLSSDTEDERPPMHANRRSLAVTRMSIQQAPPPPTVEEYEENCFYCKRTFSDTFEPQKRIKCGHIFHLRCCNINLPMTRACGICNTSVGNWVNTNDMCVYCRKLFEENDKRFTSICQHELHEDCLKKYGKERCPICSCKMEGKSSDMVCAICLENFLGSKDTFVTKCGHRFHSNCLRDWRSFDDVCPMCRKKL